MRSLSPLYAPPPTHHPPQGTHGISTSELLSYNAVTWHQLTEPPCSLPLLFSTLSRCPQGADGISTSELLYYNAVTSLPLLVVVVLLTGEASAFAPT